MKSAPSFAKDDDSTLPKEPNGSKIGLGPKPIWGMSANFDAAARGERLAKSSTPEQGVRRKQFRDNRPFRCRLKWVVNLCLVLASAGKSL
jgi:hypothetical protein